LNRRRLGRLAVAAFLVAGCGSAGASAAAGSFVTASSFTLTIFGAASLRAVLARIAAEYPSTHPGAVLTVSTDSSAALEAQIEQGAPADVFLSADTQNPEKLVAMGVAAEAVPFAGNVLTIIVPSANPGAIHGPIDLARPGVRIVAAGDTVPITSYARQLVANLARQPGYPPDYAAGYEANLVSREDNVSAIVSKVALGEGDAGIVYATDAMSSTHVITLALPPSANVIATYAGAVVTASRQQAAGRTFLQWLAGSDGQAILAEFGFRAPP
jgi:molybdate transport system substrate-binding protein